MFKVDFFEFYAVLERYVVVCLGVVGTHVSDAPRVNVNALRYVTNPDRMPRHDATHSFHANILEALDDPKCPLHDSLGSQDVRIQLGHAKDYRNAWKDADASKETREETRRKLPDFDLHHMLYHILHGCGSAHDVVRRQASPSVNALTSRDFEAQLRGGQGMGHVHDAPLEYMEDAMELD
jgi:hypothetical protein